MLRFSSEISSRGVNGKKLTSWRVELIIIGTPAERSGAAGSKGLSGRVASSTTGENASPCVASVASLRRSIGSVCSCAGVLTLSALISRSVVSTARSTGSPLISLPLIAIARWNRPSAAGIPISVLTLPAPPDCPKIVTLLGSPPKRSMLSRTQRSAWTMSSMPTLLASAKRSSSKCVRCRKPKELSRCVTGTTTTSWLRASLAPS